MPSIKEMKATITRAGLPTADLLERADVEARYGQAQSRLAEAERLRASRAPTPPPPRPAGCGPADRVPAPVLAHALGSLDNWRAIGRAAQTCRHWRGTVDDRVWRSALAKPLGMGLAIYAFERDDARPGRAKTVAVFASESEISP